MKRNIILFFQIHLIRTIELLNTQGRIQCAGRSIFVRRMQTCAMVRADLLSATILSRLEDQTTQINFLSDFYRFIGHVFMGFRFSFRLHILFVTTVFILFLFVFFGRGPIPIKIVLTLAVIHVQKTRKHIRKLETESPENSVVGSHERYKLSIFEKFIHYIFVRKKMLCLIFY